MFVVLIHQLMEFCTAAQTTKWVEDTVKTSKTFPESYWMPSPMDENQLVQMQVIVKYYNTKTGSLCKLPGCGGRRGEHFLERNKNQSNTGLLSNS